MNTTDPTTPRCLVCDQTSEQVPLIAVSYQERELWICPQHLPILIHKPGKLASVLPGIEVWEAPDHDHG